MENTQPDRSDLQSVNPLQIRESVKLTTDYVGLKGLLWYLGII